MQLRSIRQPQLAPTALNTVYSYRQLFLTTRFQQDRSHPDRGCRYGHGLPELVRRVFAPKDGWQPQAGAESGSALRLHRQPPVLSNTWV